MIVTGDVIFLWFIMTGGVIILGESLFTVAPARFQIFLNLKSSRQKYSVTQKLFKGLHKKTQKTTIYIMSIEIIMTHKFYYINSNIMIGNH